MMNRDIFRESSDAVTFAVKVIPRAAQDRVVGIEGEALKVRLSAPPVEGRANQALVRFLATVFGVSRSNVEILRGETGRHKLVRVRGLGKDKLLEKLTR